MNVLLSTWHYRSGWCIALEYAYCSLEVDSQHHPKTPIQRTHLRPIVISIHSPGTLDDDLTAILLERSRELGRWDFASHGYPLVFERDIIALNALLQADGLFASVDAGFAMPEQDGQAMKVEKVSLRDEAALARKRTARQQTLW